MMARLKVAATTAMPPPWGVGVLWEERAFGLATVRMHTAAASSDARIPGLTQIEAGRLRDHLAQLGEAKAAGL